MDSLTIRRPDDFHVHLRDGALMRQVLPATADTFARALVMGNLPDPVDTSDKVEAYRDRILRVCELENHSSFEPLMTVMLRRSTTPETIQSTKQVGVVAGKLIPDSMSTNSSGGVADARSLWPVFAAMEEVGMVLCLHGEAPERFSTDHVFSREERFLPTLFEINRAFPDLRIVLEHVSTARAAAAVAGMKNVAATITPHHLLLTVNDLLGDGLRPHHYCKPVVKFPADRSRLLKAATDGRGQFFLGTDSAPHDREAKECACGAAGVYSAPIVMPLLAQIFEEQGQLEELEPFTSLYGAKFYGLPLNTGTITLVKKPWTVPTWYGKVVPLCAGQTLQWQLQTSS